MYCVFKHLQPLAQENPERQFEPLKKTTNTPALILIWSTPGVMDARGNLERTRETFD